MASLRHYRGAEVHSDPQGLLRPRNTHDPQWIPLAEDGIHGVDESFRLKSLALCESAAHKLYEKLVVLGADR